MARVLIVDDDPQHLELMRRGLERAGFEVDTMSGPIGLTHRLRATSPDVVLMDVNLPGLRGDRAVALARGKLEKEPLFFYHSSLDADDLRELAERDGVAGWFTKSTPVRKIVEEMRR